MFTQCSKCETVYRLSAQALRAAGGQVRCGRCGEVFNALARLAEDSSDFRKGESSLDLETRVDDILHSTDAIPPADAVPPVDTTPPLDVTPRADGGEYGGPEIAQLEIDEPVDEDLAGEQSLEFTLHPGDLDRVFVETSTSIIQLLTAESAVAATPAPEAAPSPSTAPSEEHAASPPAVLATEIHAPPPTPATPAADEPLSPDAEPVLEATAAPPEGGANGTGTVALPPARNRGLEVPEKVRLEMLSSFAHAELPPIHAPPRRLPFAAWMAAAVLLTVALAVQLVLGNRDWVAVHAPLLVGATHPPADLSAYQLRQWGVTGDPAAKGILRVRASIMNSAAQLEPYPLLRLTLANRFGTRIGQREFEPVDYLGKSPSRMLSPGERVDAMMDIVDPGKDAEGFEIDVCLRGTAGKITCVGDPATAGAAAQAK